MEGEDTLTITFRKPFEDKGTTYDRITLREPTAGELVQTDGFEGYALDVRVMSIVGAMPESAVKQIPAREFLQGTRFLGGFMRAAPATGDAA